MFIWIGFPLHPYLLCYMFLFCFYNFMSTVKAHVHWLHYSFSFFSNFKELPANSVLLVYLSATGVFPTGHSDYEGKLLNIRLHILFSKFLKLKYRHAFVYLKHPLIA